MTEPDEPLWYLRVNTLRRTRLSDRTLRGLLGELADAERAVHAAAAPCSEELYDLIGATGDESVRRRLVALRRAIHNDRAPAVDETPTPAVRAWKAARERRRSLRDEVTRTHDAAADRERLMLANLLGDENLRCALALVAPEVYRESERYRSAVGCPGPVPARVRKAERGLLQYVTRAMVRTSPLSRFTAVGIAVPGAEGIDPGDVRFEQATAFPLLDRVMLGYVLGGLNVPDGDGFLDVWVGLPPTSIPDQDKLILLRPTETGIRRVTVALTGPVRLLLEAVGMGPRPVRSVIAGLVDRLGCLPEKAAGLLHSAVGQGVLCTFGEPEDGGADLAAILARPRPGAAELVDAVRTRLPELATTPAAGRGAELDALNTDLSALSRQAGRPARISVDEDYVIPPRKVATAGWRERLADLAAAVELLSVFDWLHDVRAVLAAGFVERFGAGATVPLAEHAGFLVGEVSRRTAALDAAYRAGRPLPGAGPADGSIERLYALRRQVTDALLDAFAKAGDEPEVVLPVADVLELTAELPDRFRLPPLLYGILVQQWNDRLVFNDGLPGHGMLYGRFLGADRDLGGQASPCLARRLSRHYGWDGSTVVEDLGLHRLAINAHPPVLAEGLRADDWFSLRLKHEPETDLLRVVDAGGRNLAVLQLGTGHPGLFPPPLSVASALVMSGRLHNDLPNIRHRSTPWDGRETRSCPRMAVGTTVISRRRWYGGAELAEAVAAGPGEADRLLALTAWRARHGVPEEVVVKTAPTEQESAIEAPDLGTDRLQQKPQYVDLTSALGARVLPRMLERRAVEDSTDYLEEAAPAVTDGTYAAEWVVEIGRRPGGLFEYGGELG